MAHAALTRTYETTSNIHQSLCTGVFFNEPTCYRKTVAGQFEVVHRSRALRPELRRLLILVDGRHSVDELSPCFRGNELPHLFEELVASGLIESVGAKSSFCCPSIAEAFGSMRSDSESVSRFFAVRSTASSVLRDLLGDSETLVTHIEACQNSEALRVEVGLAASKLQSRLGADAVTIFLECIREAATNTLH